jgi:uncharacterized sulfatase
MTGVDLLDPPPRDAVFGDLYVHTAVSVERPALNLTHRWMRRGDWKLIVPVDGKPELYDVRRDPHEERDLAPSRPDLVSELSKRIDSWWPAR